MSKVINRKNIVIAQFIQPGTAKAWIQPISLDFVADQVIVKHILYCGSADPAAKIDGVRFIKSSLVNDQIMGSFYDGCTYSPELVFQLPSFSNNTTYTFRIETVGGVIDPDFDGILSMHLEFTQHEK